MKDSDTLILKAFLVSLCQQKSPLPQDILVQLNDITQSLESRLIELHELAINTPTLADSYRQARLQLVSSAAERNLGIKHLKYWSDSDPQNSGSPTEGDNITPDAQEAIEVLKQALEQIQGEYDESEPSTN